MIRANSKSTSLFNTCLKKEEIPSDIISIALLQSCKDCNMTRIAMSCYAAAKHQSSEKDNKIARIQTKDKPAERKYAETEATVSLDKYNGKLMNSIWGLYNRNSPHNFKSLNQEKVMLKNTFDEGSSYKKVSFVKFAIPNIVYGVAGLETNIEVHKPKVSLEKLENIFNSPSLF